MGKGFVKRSSNDSLHHTKIWAWAKTSTTPALKAREVPLVKQSRELIKVGVATTATLELFTALNLLRTNHPKTASSFNLTRIYRRMAARMDSLA